MKELVKEIFNLLHDIGRCEISDRAYPNVSKAKTICFTALFPGIEVTDESWDDLSKIINWKAKR